MISLIAQLLVVSAIGLDFAAFPACECGCSCNKCDCDAFHKCKSDNCKCGLPDLNRPCALGKCKNCVCTPEQGCGCRQANRSPDGKLYEVVKLYWRTDCLLCPKAKEFFETHNLAVDMIFDETRTVPAIEFDNKRFEGYNELKWEVFLGLKQEPAKEIVIQSSQPSQPSQSSENYCPSCNQSRRFRR